MKKEFKPGELYNAFKSKKQKRKAIKMSKSAFVKEHKGLVKKLETGKGLKKEAKKQENELKEVKKSKKYSKKHKKETKKEEKKEGKAHEAKESKSFERSEHKKKK
jgi:hypothetical protein